MKRLKEACAKYKYQISVTAFIFNMIALAVIIVLAKGSNYVAASTDSADTKPTVILDAGHGGEDCGTIGVSGVYEKDLNFEITLKLGEYLTAAGYNVIYTRTADSLLYTDEENIKGMRKISDLKNRVKIANGYEDAIFISIDMNSYGAAECKGFQAYFSNSAEGSKELAAAIQGSVKNKLQSTNNRMTKSGSDLYILENSKNPAVILECGFLSNPDECKKLSEKEYQKELCFAILCGIIEYNKK